MCITLFISLPLQKLWTSSQSYEQTYEQVYPTYEQTYEQPLFITFAGIIFLIFGVILDNPVENQNLALIFPEWRFERE